MILAPMIIGSDQAIILTSLRGNLLYKNRKEILSNADEKLFYSNL